MPESAHEGAAHSFRIAKSGAAGNGGTLLVASTYSNDQKTKAQGINSLIVYGANVPASFAAEFSLRNTIGKS